ncbi:CHASE2 domain-containing serine/threonine-protein kinase [Caldimonas brevitalea]|uniref:non-specific serine/threonine protein kinase n=1 Tax=Caldimonas brevitalea TaxID=413882 RepID=A0A0G3BBT0_9BURK|nr:serine/threonine-protein kinase [Caldimonas brevitalea]AKJ26794.1 serine/threonine protein kinase PrkC, regulator of stationary phase [Caldimonas brevitalea]
MGKRKGSVWRADWFVGVCVVLGVLLLHGVTDFISGMERRYYDFGMSSASRVPSERIAVIAIDDRSVGNIGRWPWSREVHAQLIDKLAAAKAKTVVHTAFFFEPQQDRGLDYIRQVKQALAAEPGTAGPNSAAARVIAQAEQALDTDNRLAASLARAGNVLLASDLHFGEPVGRPDRPLPDFAQASTIDTGSATLLSADQTQQPIELLGSKSIGSGHLRQIQDPDGAIRRDALLVDYHGRAVPSLALLAAAKSLNLGPGDIRVQDDVVELGRLRIVTDGAALMRPHFYVAQGGKPAFQIDSFYEVLSGAIPASKYADKIVLIGATAAGIGTTLPTPVASSMTPVETLAHITSSILSEHFVTTPGWAHAVSLGAVALVALYLIALLPRLSAGVGATTTGVVLLVLLLGEVVVLSGSAVWLRLVLPASLLLIGHLLLTTKRFLVTEAGKQKSDEESAETNRMLGLALQGQGQLDMAFDKFRRVPLAPPVMDNLYNLALDFERKRQFNKAQAIYEHMAGYDPGYKDLQTKLARAKNLSETVMLGGAANTAATVLLGAGQVEKPMLGRYQVEKELGKGAMGVVYLGRDPKIGRQVAIKTLALSQEFEGAELDDARERFFREAETAGRLQHPHIVTIFDAGEENDLAYIAMEFLRGQDLVAATRAGALLPTAQVLSIVARVAQALAYAHQQGVVHRDIKPANIMYDPASNTVKVTDFGIARITDASRTKTGMVLGTPSFMSPEQMAGKKIDGRSDLYSLGVTLFQLLTGQLPFRGESMAELMYKIANEPTPDIRGLRPELPEALANIVALAMEKRPEVRYADGEQLAADLLKVAASLGPAPAAAEPVDDGATTVLPAGAAATALAGAHTPSSPGAASARADNHDATLHLNPRDRGGSAQSPAVDPRHNPAHPATPTRSKT